MNYIIDAYGEEIKRLIFTYVKNHTQTDDIFQDFLIKTFKSLDRFKAKSTLKTWLYRIAINTCKDYLRSPIHRIVQYHELSKISSKQQSVEQTSLENEQKETMAEAVLSLPVKYREVILLKFYRDLTINEISQSLHVKESTVRTRIMRGKKKLKTLMEGFDLE
ncbi:sigma-70 family RNA polymerase sigma factor [Virgibacillus flavescens]|uniref:sigma-70 family RNA polymerase sigma factor n=1 Tax=Virgibacillus flavescens TaxID=1611422 RepID=UPI003D33BD6F